MADLVEEVRKFLIVDGPVAALVAKRIYQTHLPQGMNTLPAIAVDEVSGVDLQELAGDVVIRKTRIRCKCYHSTPSPAATVRTAVAAALESYRGEMGSQFINTVELAGRGNGIDPPIGGDDVWRPHRFQDFMIIHRG